MTAVQFSALFGCALFAYVMVHLWLSQRQINAVARHRHTVPAEFAATVTLEAHQRAAAYTRAKMRLSMVATLVDAIALGAFTLGGGIELAMRLGQAWFGEGIAAGVAMIALVSVANSIIMLPLSLYATFKLEAHFGFNQTTAATFIADTIKSTLLSAAIGLPLVATVLWLMNAMGNAWWLWVWAVWVGFSLLMMWAFPLYIAPIFNKFEPLKNEALKARIEALMARCGFVSSGLYQMDGSKRSSHGNAYFAGMGKAKRIVFFDTLLEKLEEDEIEAVLAHELGHFKLKHIVKRLAFMYLAALGLLAVLAVLKNEAWFYQGLGVSSMNTATALVLFFLVLPVFTFLARPASAWLSRQHEFEADAFAVSMTSSAPLVSALAKLYRDNAATLTPDPVYSLYHDSHPPAAIRIAALKALG
ncbi:M48 family metallopeptidase [Chitinibacteraceae bacterium HSL-7]